MSADCTITLLHFVVVEHSAELLMGAISNLFSFFLYTLYIYRVSKKTPWKFNRLSCIINVAKQFDFYMDERTVI
jgi:hypothetical protein